MYVTINRILLSIVLTLQFCVANSQTAMRVDKEKEFDYIRGWVVAIGVVGIDSQYVDGIKRPIKQFNAIGSGLVTYVMKESKMELAIVTAGHVIKFFTQNQIDPVIRPAAADTFKTTEFFGIVVPLKNTDATPNAFLFPDSIVDLGCIVVPRTITDPLAGIYSLVKEFPIHSMTNPYLDDEVIICGYPGHIDQEIQQEFHYTFCTFKHGYVTWKPAQNMQNRDLRHICLVESNATYGNSGSPVFAIGHDSTDLVGILVGGYNEMDSVIANNQPVYLSSSNAALLAKRRAGVSIIERAGQVKDLMDYVFKQVNKD